MTGTRTMRAASLAVLIALCQFAEAEPITKVFYSGYFTGYFPTSDLEGSTLFVSEGPGIGIKLGRGGYISGMVISHEKENLDADFNLADYPLYLYGHKNTDHLPPTIAEPFVNSLKILKSSLEGPVFDTVKIDGATVYTACSHRCEAIVVQADQSEQILHLTSDGLTQADILALVKGDTNATK